MSLYVLFRCSACSADKRDQSRPRHVSWKKSKTWKDCCCNKVHETKPFTPLHQEAKRPNDQTRLYVYRKHKQFFKSTLEHPGLQARLRHDLHFIFPHQHLSSSITCLGEWRSCCHWESSLCVTWWRCLPEFWTHQRDKIDLRTESYIWAHSKLNWCSKWYDLDFQAKSPHSGRMGQLSMESILFWYVFVWQWVSSDFGKSWPATSWGQCQRHACWLKQILRVVCKVGDALDSTDNPKKIGAIVVNCLQQRLITVKPNFFFALEKGQMKSTGQEILMRFRAALVARAVELGFPKKYRSTEGPHGSFWNCQQFSKSTFF